MHWVICVVTQPPWAWHASISSLALKHAHGTDLLTHLPLSFRLCGVPSNGWVRLRKGGECTEKRKKIEVHERKEGLLKIPERGSAPFSPARCDFKVKRHRSDLHPINANWSDPNGSREIVGINLTRPLFMPIFTVIRQALLESDWSPWSGNTVNQCNPHPVRGTQPPLVFCIGEVTEGETFHPSCILLVRSEEILYVHNRNECKEKRTVMFLLRWDVLQNVQRFKLTYMFLHCTLLFIGLTFACVRISTIV